MLGTLELLGLMLPHQCSPWIYPYALERSLFRLVFSFLEVWDALDSVAK